VQQILGHSRIETTMLYTHMAATYFTNGNAEFSSLTPRQG
jgi:site-specific recombinase XerD